MITRGGSDRSDKNKQRFSSSFLLLAPTVVAAVEVTRESEKKKRILAYVCLYFIALPLTLLKDLTEWIFLCCDIVSHALFFSQAGNF
jgi:hypothetical protein